MTNSIVEKFFNFLLCPNCKSEELELIVDKEIICKCCEHVYNVIDGIPIMLKRDISTTDNFSLDKWDIFYKNAFTIYNEGANIDKYLYSQDIVDPLKYIESLWADKSKGVYMEIGSGSALFGIHMFKKGHSVIGIDTSFEALKLAQHLYKRKRAEGFFLCADMNNIPIKNEVVDLIYGGGY